MYCTVRYGIRVRLLRYAPRAMRVAFDLTPCWSTVVLCSDRLTRAPRLQPVQRQLWPRSPEPPPVVLLPTTPLFATPSVSLSEESPRSTRTLTPLRWRLGALRRLHPPPPLSHASRAQPPQPPPTISLGPSSAHQTTFTQSCLCAHTSRRSRASCAACLASASPLPSGKGVRALRSDTMISDRRRAV